MLYVNDFSWEGGYSDQHKTKAYVNRFFFITFHFRLDNTRFCCLSSPKTLKPFILKFPVVPLLHSLLNHTVRTSLLKFNK